MPLPATLSLLSLSSPAAPTSASPTFPSSHAPPLLHHHHHHRSLSFHHLSRPDSHHPSRILRCGVALGSDASPSAETEDLTAEEAEELNKKAAMVGSRVRVKAPLKVYHVPRVPEVELTGLEGEVKQFVGLWKGKRISANYPFKVEFKVDIDGRGLVKFVSHLKEDEIEFI